MLRVSSEFEGEKVDLKSITKGSDVQSGVPSQNELIKFAEVAMGDNDEEISNAREDVRAKMGDAAVVDSAGVIANFQRMVRIADGAGIPLDTPMAVITASIRSELGLDSYGSSDSTPQLTFMQRILGRLLNPFLSIVFKQVAKRVSSSE